MHVGPEQELLLLRFSLDYASSPVTNVDWRRVLDCGLGPFILVVAKRLHAPQKGWIQGGERGGGQHYCCLDGSGNGSDVISEASGVAYAVHGTAEEKGTPIIRRLLCPSHEYGGGPLFLQLHATCLSWKCVGTAAGTIVRGQGLWEESPIESTMTVGSGGRVSVLPCGTVSADREEDVSKERAYGEGTKTEGWEEDDGGLFEGELTSLSILELLREASVWNMSLLEKHAALKQLLTSGAWVNSQLQPCCVTMAVQSIYYLMESMPTVLGRVGCAKDAREADCSSGLMEILIGWSGLLHETVTHSLSPCGGALTRNAVLPVQETGTHNIQDGSDDSVMFGALKANWSQAGSAGCLLSRSNASLTDEFVVPIELCAGSGARAVDMSNVLGCVQCGEHMSEALLAQGQFQSQAGLAAMEETPMTHRPVSGYFYSALSLCNEVVVGAARLQQQLLAAVPSGGTKTDEGDVTSPVDNSEVGTCPRNPPAASECKAEDNRGVKGIPLSDGADEWKGQGMFLPSLVLRTATAVHQPSVSARRFCRCLRSIAIGDFFPRQGWLERADTLRLHLGDTANVWFYDLDPQQLLGLSKKGAVRSGMPTHSAAPDTLHASVGRNTGHPCFLYVTETDIVLASAFDRMNKRKPSLPHLGGVGTRVDGVGKRCDAGEKGLCVTGGDNTPRKMPYLDSNFITGEDGSDAESNDPCDVSDTIELRLVIPRIALMDVQQLCCEDGSPSAVLMLQTRSCRRIWLAFPKESMARVAFNEIYRQTSAAHEKLFIASAQRPWRMAALTLVAGDVLPESHKPFYRQALQNILVAFADVQMQRTLQDERKVEGQPAEQGTTSFTGWWQYTTSEEFKRQGTPVRQWRITEANKEYVNFSTYPQHFTVPSCLNDDALKRIAKVRARGRVGALTYYYAPGSSGIVRAAQPAVVKSLCASAASEPESSDSNNAYRLASGRLLYIFDLRSGISALGNALVGGGFTICEERRFCSLGNIHEVRSSYEMLCEEVIDSNPKLSSDARGSGDFKRQMPAVVTVTAPSSALFRLRLQPDHCTSQPPMGKGYSTWMEHICGLLKTAESAARLVAGVAEERGCSPAVVDEPMEEESSLTDGCARTSVRSRSLRGSSTIHIWTRAFHDIHGRISTAPRSREWAHGATAAAPSFSSASHRSVPSYVPLQDRKAARLVMVNCSDGWDRTPQVCALAQLLLDPFYRTVQGFLVLIEKEFVSFGHPFITRSTMSRDRTAQMDVTGQRFPFGITSNRSGPVDGMEASFAATDTPPTTQAATQSSPIMLQFIDAVHQLLRMYPHCFEFTENFLLLIVDVLHSGIVGTFAANCEAEIKRWNLEERTLSLSQLIAIILATTLPTGGMNSRRTAEPRLERQACKNLVENASMSIRPPRSSASVPVLTLAMLYAVGGGGPSLYDTFNSTTERNSSVLTRTSMGRAPHRLHISQDAMLYSGLLNPHFSLSDNELFVGPLLDPLTREHIVLWEKFFLRYNFCCERRHLLQRLGELSATTFHARAAEVLRNAATVFRKDQVEDEGGAATDCPGHGHSEERYSLDRSTSGIDLSCCCHAGAYSSNAPQCASTCDRLNCAPGGSVVCSSIPPAQLEAGRGCALVGGAVGFRDRCKWHRPVSCTGLRSMRPLGSSLSDGNTNDSPEGTYKGTPNVNGSNSTNRPLSCTRQRQQLNRRLPSSISAQTLEEAQRIASQRTRYNREALVSLACSTVRQCSTTASTSACGPGAAHERDGSSAICVDACPLQTQQRLLETPVRRMPRGYSALLDELEEAFE